MKTGQVAFEIKEDEERGSFVGISNDQVILHHSGSGVMEYITIAGENRGRFQSIENYVCLLLKMALPQQESEKGGNAGRMSGRHRYGV